MTKPLFVHAGITYRSLDAGGDDLAAVVALQAEVWDAATVTPRNNLIATTHSGGVVLGAFDASGACAGFSYAFAAYDGAQTWLHSHQTAVRSDLRGTGVGATLKWLQRNEALALGYEHVRWTFDPLVARNAAFNLERLGATADRYAIDLYGPMNDPMNRGLPTDRLWADWSLRGPRACTAFERDLPRLGLGLPGLCRSTTGIRGTSDTPRVPQPPTVLKASADGRPEWVSLAAGGGTLLVQIPADIAAVKRASFDTALAWRKAVRQVFSAYLPRGYAATGMMRTSGPHACYQLTRKEQAA